MPRYTEPDLRALRDAAQTLKLYRRADLESDSGDNIVEDLYVDPLPNNHVLNTMTRLNTTFVVGRKGTGKSTVFQRSQRAFLANDMVVSAYIDIKTVYEQSVSTTTDRASARPEALEAADLQTLLLLRSFVLAVVSGIRQDIQEQLKSAHWTRRAKEKLTGSVADLLDALDQYIEDVSAAEFVDVTGVRATTSNTEEASETGSKTRAGTSLRIKKDPGLDLSAEHESANAHSARATSNYSSILLRTMDIRTLIERLRDVLAAQDIKHLILFVDDFSELPREAMETVVDVLLAPLNNWSNELVKLKIAAYPNRIYYGQIDKTKIDEINLDLHSLYGGSSVSEMETKAADFTYRLLDTRLQYFGLEFDTFIDEKSERSHLLRLMFQACLGNPRTLGYILYFIYESSLIYDRPISTTAIRDASRRYYEEKIESYFSLGRFLHESFDERSSIYSLKELLERIVQRARALRRYRESTMLRSVKGQHPTSHFHLREEFEPLLSTLELNFFVTKYYVMSDRDGQRVAVYALNYGLCQKYSIEFGRPDGERTYRLYFVERVFDYNPIFQDYVASHQEISCDTCDEMFEHSQLPALQMYGMRCPSCGSGTCLVTNVSRKYESVLRSVDAAALLPSTELGMIDALGSQEPLHASDIAAELDVSYQLIGWRAKRLAERDLVDRSEFSKGRREFRVTELARRIYLSDPAVGELDVSGGDKETARDASGREAHPDDGA